MTIILYAIFLRKFTFTRCLITYIRALHSIVGSFKIYDRLINYEKFGARRDSSRMERPRESHSRASLEMLLRGRRFAGGRAAPEFVPLLSEYTEVQAASQRARHVTRERLGGRDVVFAGDARQDLLLGKTVGRLLGTQQVVNENGTARHSANGELTRRGDIRVRDRT